MRSSFRISAATTRFMMFENRGLIANPKTKPPRFNFSQGRAWRRRPGYGRARRARPSSTCTIERSPGCGPNACRMNRTRQRAQSRNQRGRGSVQEFVGDAIDLRISHCSGVSPASFIRMGDLRKWHAIPGPAPGGDDYFRILSSDLFGGALCSRLAQEFAPSRVHQFSHPWLRCDDRLSPLLREHALSGKVCGLASHLFDCRLHIGNHFRPRSPAPTDAEIKAISV